MVLLSFWPRKQWERLSAFRDEVNPDLGVRTLPASSPAYLENTFER